MSTSLNGMARWSGGELEVRTSSKAFLAVVLLLMGGTGCGPLEPVAEPSEPTARHAQSLEAHNGLSTNGLSTNGLSTNGLSTNGLSTNGLSTNGFAAWFQQDPASNNVLMRYLVHCAVPARQTRSYVDPATGVQYSWSGGLGLAPDWSGGTPATVREQQVVSACLGAHANKYGLNVSISLLGLTATDLVIPYTSVELSAYEKKEGCFFGNLFNGEGLFVGNDSGLLDDEKSSVRACALDSVGCLQLTRVGSCVNICRKDSTNTYYVSCSRNGITYRPITTRMRDRDIYECGDGICQFTERCGNDDKSYSCMADCGTCG